MLISPRAYEIDSPVTVIRNRRKKMLMKATSRDTEVM
jgi:hypothetical protein